MNEFLCKLLKQFIAATGVKNVDFNSQRFQSDFLEWINTRKLIGREYISFLSEIRVNPSIIGGQSIEVGKGKYDSIALDTDMRMTTPYSSGIKRTDGGLITAGFLVYEGIPIMTSHDNKGNNQILMVQPQDRGRFITQNPYDVGCIRGWDQLYGAGEDITVGIFGDIHDKDINEKIKLIERLDDQNDGALRVEYDVEKDNYYCAISSSRKVKVKIKTKEYLR